MKSKSRLFGATLIISGTTIGAGMIALPITSAHLGFVMSTFLLIGMWILMSYTALVTLEVNLHFGHGVNISTAAERLLGSWGRVVSSAAIMILFYSLLAAYIAGGSSIINAGIKGWFDLEMPKIVVPVVFTAFLGLFVYARTGAVDYLNRLLFALMLVFFTGLIFLLLPSAKSENLMSSASQFGPFWVVIPVFFAAFGFHGSIPPIVDYLGHNPKRLKFAFVIGSFVPLLFYLLWQTMTVGVLPLLGDVSFNNVFESGSDVGVFVGELNSMTGSKVLPVISNSFTALAIATSFLGVGIALMEFFLQKFKWHHTPKDRLKGVLITFVLPLAFAMLYPQGFVMALGFSAVALSVIAVIMPVLMALVIRGSVKSREKKGYTVAGGKLSLLLALAVGLLVVFIQMALVFKS